MSRICEYVNLHGEGQEDVVLAEVIKGNNDLGIKYYLGLSRWV